MSQKSKTHKIAITGMLAAVATVLMFLDFSVPFLIPPFVKLDFSELPALLASFSLGPVSGVAVCLIKNLINCLRSTTGCVGELCNFLLGVCFVVPAGLIYRHKKSRKSALIGSVIGAVSMAVLSIPLNYFVTYPIYTVFLPIEQIVAMYQSIRPGVNGLLECLTVFNAPFTLIKGMLDVGLCFLIYKPLSPLLHR
jgi:riboflavin transporter FmnP